MAHWQEPIEYHERCPKCGSTLITNGRAVWCTYVGGRDKRLEPGCSFRATLNLEPLTDPATETPAEYTDLSADELFREDEQDPITSPLGEALAEYAHDAWSGWMRYLFSKCAPVSNMPGYLVIPDWAVVRWQRQAGTPYAELPESEKESDRKEARKMIRIFIRHLDEGDD